MRENIFKLLYLLGTPKVLRLNKHNKLTILSLHRVSFERDFFFDPISPSLFRQLLEYVKMHYEVITFDEIQLFSKPTKKPLLILSFDDGYYDFYEYALPILRSLNLKSNHNIVNDCANSNSVIWTQRLNSIFNQTRNNKVNLIIDIQDVQYKCSDFDNNWMKFYLKVFRILLTFQMTERLEVLKKLESQYSVFTDCRMMNWDEIVECSNNNVEIGSHTYSHDVISTITNPEFLTKEFELSRIEIESKINKKVSVLSLPNGQGDRGLNEVIEKSGFQFLLFVNDDVNKISFNTKNTFEYFNRINLLNESLPEMILRVENFHHLIRR